MNLVSGFDLANLLRIMIFRKAKEIEFRNLKKVNAQIKTENHMYKKALTFLEMLFLKLFTSFLYMSLVMEAEVAALTCFSRLDWNLLISLDRVSV